MITYKDELYHHGVKGMRWGVRRYQNPDGTLTYAGRKRYLLASDKNFEKIAQNDIARVEKQRKKAINSAAKSGDYSAVDFVLAQRQRKFDDIGLAALNRMSRENHMDTVRDYTDYANSTSAALKYLKSISKDFAESDVDRAIRYPSIFTKDQYAKLTELTTNRKHWWGEVERDLNDYVTKRYGNRLYSAFVLDTLDRYTKTDEYGISYIELPDFSVTVKKRG